jgi:hypothetical protein
VAPVGALMGGQIELESASSVHPEAQPPSRMPSGVPSSPFTWLQLASDSMSWSRSPEIRPIFLPMSTGASCMPHGKLLDAIVHCGTAASGGHLYRSVRCDHSRGHLIQLMPQSARPQCPRNACARPCVRRDCCRCGSSTWCSRCPMSSPLFKRPPYDLIYLINAARMPELACDTKTPGSRARIPRRALYLRTVARASTLQSAYTSTPLWLVIIAGRITSYYLSVTRRG